MTALHPHLFFDGKAEAAFQYYHTVFGGKLDLHRYKDMPDETPAGFEERIMHVSLHLNNHTVLMGADWHPGAGPIDEGTSFAVYIAADSREQVDQYFKALSEGGRVNMPVEDTFWGSYFGMATDKFGTNWMIGYDKAQ